MVTFGKDVFTRFIFGQAVCDKKYREIGEARNREFDSRDTDAKL